nr:hypothetical protein [Tanacetum cinerariifolium]
MICVFGSEAAIEMMKRKPRKTKFKEDRISSLPDCLLVDIISRLPDTEEAVATGKLSKRWKHLWPQVYNLIFKHEDDCDNRIRKFFSFVDKFLSQRGQSNINEFILHCSFENWTKSQVNNYIRYAINHNVQVVDLDLWDYCQGTGFVLPEFFFISSSFIHLRLHVCEFDQTGVIRWKNLKSLSITCGVLHEDLIQNILSGSPRLETLVLNDCGGFDRLDITNKSVKNLVLSGLDEHEADSIKINAPYILSLTVQDRVSVLKLLLLNVSSVIKAELNYYYKKTYFGPEEMHGEMLKGLILSLGHVKELKIRKLCLEALARLKSEGFICPSNLKVLEEIDSN